MIQFKHAIVRRPSESMIHGISSANLGKPDFTKALQQHDSYIQALKTCGLHVEVLAPNPTMPDACFIEDVAICTPTFAQITRPGATTRLGEIEGIEAVLAKYYDDVKHIHAPGTLEGGDVMMVGSHFYVGLSARTNAQGADQFIDHLSAFGLSGEKVPLFEMLHFKTGLSYIERNNLLISGEFISNRLFAPFNQLIVDSQNAYAANSVWINDHVLVPKGFSSVSKKIKDLDYEIIELDVSEFEKLDGGLSCLSLRF